MKPEIKERWTTALRSGEYRQTNSTLRSVTNDSYCCLGVLCELAKQDGIVEREDGTAWSTYFVGDGTDSSDSNLPVAVQVWAGLGEADPELNDGYDWNMASEWNDIEHKTFPEIADLIERSL